MDTVMNSEHENLKKLIKDVHTICQLIRADVQQRSLVKRLIKCYCFQLFWLKNELCCNTGQPLVACFPNGKCNFVFERKKSLYLEINAEPLIFVDEWLDPQKDIVHT